MHYIYICRKQEVMEKTKSINHSKQLIYAKFESHSELTVHVLYII